MLRTVPNVSQLVGTGSATEIVVKWTVADSSTDEPVAAGDFRPVNRFEVTSRRTLAGGVVRERAPQLSAENLVVIAVDASGRELTWQQVRDPRIVRAEIPDDNLRLSGQTLYRPVTELLVTVPDGLSPVAIRVLEVQLTGTEFALRQIGEIAVSAR